MTTSSYLFYSPQLSSQQGSSSSHVPPLTSGPPVHTQQSPSLVPTHPSMMMANDLNLTPQFGPFVGRPNDGRSGRHMGGDVDVSFLGSANGHPSGVSPEHHPVNHPGPQGNFLPQYMPVYTSPAYNPMHTQGSAAYSPMFAGIHASPQVHAQPMFYGQQSVPHSFDPLPDTSWSSHAQKEMYGGPPPPHVQHAPHHQQPPYHRGDPTRIAQFSQLPPPNTHTAPFPQEFTNGGGKSVILEDLRGVSHPRAHTLQDIVNEGLVADLATDQNGSRFIQTKLEEASDAEKQAVFEQILPEALRLCTDVFGNYCIQKFFEYGTPEQKQQLSQKIMHRVLPLSLQMYGCRVVQKILESVDAETQKLLVRELDQHVLECVKDQNANHVIQKCIEQVNGRNNIDFIIKAFYGRVFDLSTHPYGCRVIQRMLEHCYPDLKELTQPVLDELMSYAEQLAKDQYGNYVLQHVLQHSSDDAKNKIVDTVARNILPFSKHKFASNVVERCFVSTDTRQKEILLTAVVGSAETSPLISMVRDQYGNYVIQKMLETLNVPQRNKLIRKISEFVPNIRKIAFGKHIVAKIEKLTGKVI